MRRINGNISKIRAGEFNTDKNNVKPIDTFSFLKNSSSLKRFKINTKLIIIENTKTRDFRNTDVINLI